MKTIKTTKVAKATLVVTSIIFISLILTGISYAKFGPENYMGVWLFDEDEGDIAGDSSGNGNDGTLNGGPKWVEGKFGNALEFDGEDDYVEVPDDETLDTKLSDGFTIMAWAKMYNADEDGGVISKVNAWEDGMCYILNCNHGNNFEFAPIAPGGQHDVWLHGADIEENVWYHVTATYDGEAVSIYYGGEPANSTPYSLGIADTDAPLLFGTFEPGDGFFNGAIDEVAIFNTVLTEDDMKAIMNDGLEAGLAVSPADKLATTWGQIKY